MSAVDVIEKNMMEARMRSEKERLMSAIHELGFSKDDLQDEEKSRLIHAQVDKNLEEASKRWQVGLKRIEEAQAKALARMPAPKISAADRFELEKAKAREAAIAKQNKPKADQVDKPKQDAGQSKLAADAFD